MARGQSSKASGNNLLFGTRKRSALEIPIELPKHPFLVLGRTDKWATSSKQAYKAVDKESLINLRINEETKEYYKNSRIIYKMREAEKSGKPLGLKIQSNQFGAISTHAATLDFSSGTQVILEGEQLKAYTESSFFNVLPEHLELDPIDKPFVFKKPLRDLPKPLEPGQTVLVLPTLSSPTGKFVETKYDFLRQPFESNVIVFNSFGDYNDRFRNFAREFDEFDSNQVYFKQALAPRKVEIHGHTKTVVLPEDKIIIQKVASRAITDQTIEVLAGSLYLQASAEWTNETDPT